jgi:alcohol dehydrogenase
VDNSLSKSWEFYNPVRLVAGAGCRSRLAELLAGRQRLLLVTDKGGVERGYVDMMRATAPTTEISLFDAVEPNPDIETLKAMTKRHRASTPNLIVAIGGGSVVDSGKILGVTLAYAGDVAWDDAVRAGKQLWKSRIPVVTLPTTSGTGAEVTPFATIWERATKRKYSVQGDLVFPSVGLLDPELTLSLPPSQTLYTGLDAVSHAMESLWNRYRTPASEAYAIRSLRIAVEALPRVLKQPADLVAREAMQVASTLAGLAISQSRTAIAHSLSYPVTMHFDVPHGLACSFTLPELLRQNRSAMANLLQDEPLLAAIEKLLADVDLKGEMAKFVKPGELDVLKHETLNQDRLGNFEGTLACAPFEVIERSL